MQKYLLIGVLLMTLVGCQAVPKFVKKVPIPFKGEATEVKPKASTVRIDGQILLPQMFTSKSTVLVLPLKAGSKTVANERFDRISLMIVKNVVELLAADTSGLKAVISSQADEADMELSGFIQELKEPGKTMRKLMGQKNNGRIMCDLTIVDSENNRRIASIQIEDNFSWKKMNDMQVAQKVAAHLVQYLLENYK